MKLSHLTVAVFPLLISPAFAQEATTEPTDTGAAEDAPAITTEPSDAGADPDTTAEPADAGDAEELPVTTTEPAEAGDAEQAPATTTVPADASEAEEAPAAVSDVVVQEQSSAELRSDWLDGSTITSPKGETIGDIVDLIIDTEEGGITAAIVSVGGFLGIGAKQIAVDWNELQIDYDGQEITLEMTREEADNAPEYAFRERQDPPPPAPVPVDGGTAGGTGSPVAPAAPLE